MKHAAKIPNLFIVGAPKCATTSLHHYLQQHPDIAMCKIKEPHFFCTDFHRECDTFHQAPTLFEIRDESAYLSLFSHWKGEKIVGESSTSYLYSQTAADHIYDFNADAKIIIVLREPVSLLYSWHSHLVNNREETIDDFKSALSAEHERKQDWANLPLSVKHPFRLYYTEVVKLADQVQRYLDLFNKENICILLFDDVKNDTDQAYQQILDFLSIDSKFKPDFSIQNPNQSPRSLWVSKLITSKYGQASKNFLKQKLSTEFYLKLRQVLLLNSKTRLRNPMDFKLQHNLKKVFKPQVIQLTNILNRDLVTLWEYSDI